jgi:hypothetical protein
MKCIVMPEDMAYRNGPPLAKPLVELIEETPLS